MDSFAIKFMAYWAYNNGKLSRMHRGDLPCLRNNFTVVLLERKALRGLFTTFHVSVDHSSTNQAQRGTSIATLPLVDLSTNQMSLVVCEAWQN